MQGVQLYKRRSNAKRSTTRAGSTPARGTCPSAAYPAAKTDLAAAPAEVAAVALSAEVAAVAAAQAATCPQGRRPLHFGAASTPPEALSPQRSLSSP